MDYYPTNSAQETKETNKQSRLTISCEKRSCLIRNKKTKAIIIIKEKRKRDWKIHKDRMKQ